MIKINNKNSLAITSLFSLLIITFYIYIPGLNGIFMLDDMPNLSTIGKYTDLDSWSNFWIYLLEGNSGPTGRPISLASFYLNDNAWPSQPSGFIYTNIMIHLFNGALLYWFVTLLGSELKLSSTKKIVFAILSTALWLLHPMNTTTVLYIVQRMTELSATFTLTGLIFYLIGREKLLSSTKKGLLFLFFGVGGSLILSILSKENGILLVAYILVIEYFLLRPFKNTPPKGMYYWLYPSVIFPFVFILLYLLNRAITGNGFEIRDFSMYERLLTESRILFDYMQHILIPRIGDMSLYHDDYVISKSLFDPWTTLISSIGIILLFISAIILRKKHSLYSFAILWFFAGHLLESTVLSLELYFEHRNYLPMLGFFISISIWIAENIKKYQKPITIFVSLGLILFSFLTFQNAVLWGKPVEMTINWHNEHPNSLRAQDAYSVLVKSKKIDKQNDAIKIRNPYTILWDIEQACKNDNINIQVLSKASKDIEKYVIHPVTATPLREFMLDWLGNRCENISSQQMEVFLKKILTLATSKKSSGFVPHVYYWLSELYRKEKDLNNTMINLEEAYKIQPDSQLLIIQASTLFSAGLKKEALERLEDTKLLETTFRKRIILSLVQPQIDNLKNIIEKSM